MDTLIGGDTNPGLPDGIDTIDYSEKTGDVRITLSDTSQTIVKVDGVAEDTISEFENANGGSGDDVITGSAVANRLVGNGGNDLLIGGEGGDTLVGGLGDDIYYANFGDVVVEAAGEGIDTVATDASHTLAANVENLTLVGDGPLSGTGNALANMIFGSDGNNVLDGRLAADTMTGGLGNDTYVVDNVGDTVTEAAGEGADTVNASVSFALGANVENLVLTGASAINGTGNDLANAVTGNAGANVLAGGLGLDLLAGGEGSDTFVFDTKLGKTNVDTIADFAAGFDYIGLDADIFKKVNDSGALKAKFFASGKADDGNDFIIHKKKTDALYYDRDGDGDKFGKVKFATVLDDGAHQVKLDAGDFLIV
jgi:Ca2+-binding RTX toxin-like protein